MTRRLSLALLVMLSASFLVPQDRASHRATSPLLFTSTPRYEPLAWLEGANRFPQGASVMVKNGNAVTPLASEFYATADANVSFDAKSVLFSGKKHSTDHWQIWQIAVPGGTPTQVTHCDDDCVTPFHVPGDEFVYARLSSRRFVLEIASLTSNQPAIVLTHAPGNYLPTEVLQDGRILFASDYPLDDGATAELYTVYPDGSGVEAYRCDHGRSRYAGKQVSSGDVVFTRDGKLLRFTSPLAHEVSVGAPSAVYAGDVVEGPTGAWIVSSKGADGDHFALRTWKPGASNLLPLVNDAKANIVQPALVAERPVPKRFPSALHEWSYANVLCLSAYTSKDRIPEGSVAAVRLYTRDDLGTTHVQGTAQVEKDGSFYLRVPGDTPLKIELLDGLGRVVKAEAGWFWLRSGEQRICVGCHAGPERAPENASPMVLQHSTVPADLTVRKAQSPAAGGH